MPDAQCMKRDREKERAGAAEQCQAAYNFGWLIGCITDYPRCHLVSNPQHYPTLQSHKHILYYFSSAPKGDTNNCLLNHQATYDLEETNQLSRSVPQIRRWDNDDQFRLWRQVEEFHFTPFLPLILISLLLLIDSFCDEYNTYV